MEIWSLETQKKRLDNVKYAAEKVKKCGKRVRIHDYIPGQVTYNLGPYPAKFSIEPTEYDYNLIKTFAENGVGLIQIHEEWNDHIRRFGADKFTSHDPEGLKNFVKLCHDFGIKVLPYISTGYFDRRDPDFKKEFHNLDLYLESIHFAYCNCSPKSPEWCNYLFDKLKRVLNDYEFDGLYNDSGSEEFAYRDTECIKRGTRAVEADIQYDPFEEDMYARLYSFVKENNGILKLHYALNTKPVSDEKLYDYLWVGEGVSSVEDLLNTTKFDPYIVPCPDFEYLDDSEMNKVFAQALPFLQFPLRPDGRPFDAEAIISVPDIEYFKTSRYDYYLKMIEYNKAHPDGPYVYSDWSNIPDSEIYRDLWFKYLKLYKPMVEENNICHMNISESTLIKGRLPKNVYMSLFTGNEQYLCLSNLTNEEQTIILSDNWEDRETKKVLNTVTIPVNELKFLKRV